MNQQNKKGFSLVEVMLLFVVMAVILAASVPLVSRKSRPIPSKINHGVYRCISTPNGLLEELYTGSRRVVPAPGVQDQFVQACHFTVPKAVLYRVDLYSAGAGGTLAGVISSNQDDNREATYNSDTTYTGFTTDIDNIPEDERSLVRRLTNGEIAELFSNDTLIRNFATSSAGSGGTARFRLYPSPYSSVCRGRDIAIGNSRRAYDAEANSLVNGTDEYRAAFEALDLAVSNAESRRDSWKALLDDADSFKTNYEKLAADVNNLSQIKSWLDDLSTAEIYASLRAGVASYSSVRDKFRVLESAIAENIAVGVISDATDERDTAYDLYDDSGYEAEIAAAVAKKKAAAIAAAEDAATAAGKTAEDIAQAKTDAETNFDEAKAEAEARKENPKKSLSDFPVADYIEPSTYQAPYKSGGYAGLENYIKTDSTACSAELNAGSYSNKVKDVKTAANNLYNSTYNSWKELDDILKAHDASDFSTLKTIAQEEYDKAVEDLATANAARQAKWDEIRAHAERLLNVYNSVLDQSPASVLSAHGFSYDDVFDNINNNDYTALENSNTGKQISDFCRYAYDAKNAPDAVLRGAFFMSTSSGYARGGSGGSGKRLILEFPITFRADDTFLNPEQYLRDIQDTNSPKSFRQVRCSSQNGNLGDNCTSAGAPSLNGESRTEVDYSIHKFSSDVMEYDAPDRQIITTDGRDLSTATYPYSAWSIPYYEDGVVRGRNNITITQTLPTGGRKGELYVHETNNNGTYTHKTIEGANEMSIADVADQILDKKYTYSMSITGGARGEDATFTHISPDAPFTQRIFNDQNTVASVYATNAADTTRQHPSFKDIQVDIASSLWTKTYQVGGPGSRGRFATYLAAGLGTGCDFTVPNGGPVLDLYGDHEPIEDLERALNVSIRCTNRDGRSVFERTLTGGRYNVNLETPQNSRFVWYRGVEDHVVGSSAPVNEVWRPTSIWAKVYTNFMGGFNNYDLSRIYRVGAGGEGTTLTDSCTEPRGFYTLTKLYNIRYGAWDTTELVNSNQQIRPAEFPGNSSNGVPCYGIEDENANNIAEYILDNEHPDEFFMEAGEGGGGAVVITW